MHVSTEHGIKKAKSSTGAAEPAAPATLNVCYGFTGIISSRTPLTVPLFTNVQVAKKAKGSAAAAAAGPAAPLTAPQALWHKMRKLLGSGHSQQMSMHGKVRAMRGCV